MVVGGAVVGGAGTVVVGTVVVGTVVVGTVTDVASVVVTGIVMVEDCRATSEEVPQPPAISAGTRASDSSEVLGEQPNPVPCRIGPVDHRSDPAGPRRMATGPAVR